MIRADEDRPAVATAGSNIMANIYRPRAPPLLRKPGAQDVGGRGLQLVQTLTTQWGVELRPRTGKAVWLQLPFEPAAAA